ncbi:aminoglycoside phosphotransferase family protein [Arthrobacter monumenti]
MEISTELVRRLISEQFPQWNHLPVEPVAQQGWDNRTFRLGEELTVRLPSAEGYVAGVEKEDRVLPFLAAQLPLAVPVPVSTGRPGPDYPFPWSVRRWLPGDTVESRPVSDRSALAEELGNTLAALRAIRTDEGPAAGRHSFFRGCHPSVYSDEVQDALAKLSDDVDVAACRKIWVDATASAWHQDPVWFHGDVAVGNILVQNGRLSALIDFGTCGVGDPACDLVMAWTYFTGDERQIFRKAVGLPDDVWRRARGWALWKALVTMAGLSSPDPEGAQRRLLAEILTDPVA